MKKKNKFNFPRLFFFCSFFVDILNFMLSIWNHHACGYPQCIRMRFTHDIILGVDLMKMIRFLEGYLGDVLSSRLDGHTQTDVDMNWTN